MTIIINPRQVFFAVYMRCNKSLVLLRRRDATNTDEENPEWRREGRREVKEGRKDGGREDRGNWPLDPVKRRSSVQSTQRTALLCPSATWTHCNVADRPLLVDGTGLMTPLENTPTSLSTDATFTIRDTSNLRGAEMWIGGVMHSMQLSPWISVMLEIKKRKSWHGESEGKKGERREQSPGTRIQNTHRYLQAPLLSSKYKINNTWGDNERRSLKAAALDRRGPQVQ